jgi:hypothetical protein
MYGTREELCVQLENMFTFDEPLVLLVWTEEGLAWPAVKPSQNRTGLKSGI